MHNHNFKQAIKSPNHKYYKQHIGIDRWNNFELMTYNLYHVIGKPQAKKVRKEPEIEKIIRLYQDYIFKDFK